MDYIAHAFFDGEVPGTGTTTPDCVVWACRGGGKTFLGAVATALDLLFKPGIEVRILAGSLEQASRMHGHLRKLFEREDLKGELEGKITDRRIVLRSGSRVELLSSSQASVRGSRPQKLRCDEVELFDPEVWEAAQLTTRSAELGGRWVRGAVEALSTMHRPYGLMSKIVKEPGRRMFKWNVMDVMERCEGRSLGGRCSNGPESVCPLLNECKGSAERRGVGHIRVADAITLKSRVSRAVWEAEMLCLRPNRGDCVLPEFDVSRHVVKGVPWEGTGRSPQLWMGGMDFGFRSPTVFLWAAEWEGVLYVVDERHETHQTLEAHIRAILESTNPRPAWVGADPAGKSRSLQSGVSDISCLEDAGLAVRARRCSVREGLALIRARLSPADGGPARLMIHERCVRLTEAMEKYHFDEERPENEEPVKDGPDHAVDALRYLVTGLDRVFATVNDRWI